MKINILLVDDEKDFVETLAERLEIRGFSALTALNGEEALKLVQEKDFDVILLDVRMPGKDGLEVLQEIKSIKPIIQVIMLTGHATVQSAVDGMKMGAFDYLMKPTETNKLFEMINNAYKLVEDQKNRIRQAEIDKIIKKRGW